MGGIEGGTGAFYLKTNVGYSAGGGTAGADCVVGFFASNSNQIYNHNTVQPLSIRFFSVVRT